jgi:TolA-binding protein
VLYELAWTYKGLSKHTEAAEAFAKLAANHDASPLAAESLYHVGEYAYEAENFKDAGRSYLAARDKAGQSELGEKSSHKLGWSYFRLDEFAQSQQAFARQRATFPQGPLAPDATFMEAESLFKQGKHAEALALFEQVKNPSSEEFRVLSLLHGGQAACQLKQWSKGLALLDQTAKAFPDSPHLPEVMYEQAWARQNLGQVDEALQAYEGVTAKTNREVAARARFMIGEIYFERKDHKQAVTNFYKVAYGYSYPEWQANALYEAARCLEVLKKVEQAKKDYQEIVTKFPDSSKATAAQKRLAELK